MARGAKVECKCKWCKQPFTARVADRKRGWAKFCSKSCKASWQEKATGGQYKKLMARGGPLTPEQRRERENEQIYDAGMTAAESGWDGHKST